MKTDELPIILRIVGGKTEEFAYFLNAYGQQVFTLIARMVGSEEDAQELTQDTFLKAYQHLDSFNGGSSFSTWIYRIAYNTALSALRKKPSEVLAFDDKMWASLSDTEIDRECSPSIVVSATIFKRSNNRATSDESTDFVV